MPTTIWSFSLNNSFSFLVVIASLSCSLYLFYEWIKHKKSHPFPLFWAIAIILFYISQIPTVLVNSGWAIYLSNYNLFYSVSIPLIFLGWIFVYLGMLYIEPDKNQNRINVFLTLWFLLSLVVHFFYFYTNNVYSNQILRISVASTIIPLNILILLFSLRWLWKDIKNNMLVGVGILTIIIAMLISLVRYGIVLNVLVNYKPQFWFFTIISNDIISFLRSLVIILLTIGFFLIHRHYFKK